ncbi:MAG TPA: molybdenum cofactor guanylyltransferase, partial [Bacteroidales bacterium]|nr:molybdenum cofactor guanylyltransferase [Bacteroidales bacterium]
MTVNQQITGIILAGGKSSRMGISKAWLTIENKRFIENAISILRPYCHNILISANTREYNTYGYEVVCDRYPSIGPMGGLEACLNRSETEKNLVIPCDVPNISAMIIHHILHSVNDAYVVVPIWDNNTLEPLIGYYSKRIYPIIIEQIEKREYSIIQLLRRVQTRYVHLHGFKLHNVNTPTDYWVSTQQC